MLDLLHKLGFQPQSALDIPGMILRLLIAAILGGIIGLDREIRHKAAGLRTNMFICIGSAMFTLISMVLSKVDGGDPQRIAAQIIPGIGFIGAGSIMRSQMSIQGLTTAATIFVAAAIGMATGGGLYGVAVFATLLIVLCLNGLGWAEKHFNLKIQLVTYELKAREVDGAILAVNRVLEPFHKMIQNMQTARVNDHIRIQFTLEGTHKEHARILQAFRGLREAVFAECVKVTEVD